VKQYRQDAHLVSLIFWAILCIAVAVVLFDHSHKILSRRLRDEEILAGATLLVLGPVVLALYLIRARLVTVSVSPEEGIRVREAYVIPWDQIYRIERRRPLFRKSTGPAQIPEMPQGAEGCANFGGCADPGCAGSAGEILAGVGILLAVLAALWFLFFVFVPLLVVPILEVFAPFGDRIILEARGRRLVLRDLREADEFLARVAPHCKVIQR
jgi:hypothetical protein